ncbi:MAG: NAD(P)-dependent oxidoreductase, partial [Verrucomicrobiota bacterium]|nr:NAD(P)-dependent oxidoreductase [Verrucomicrobiota bacterium]
STVAPDTMREASEIVQRRGAQLLDAPFTGSKDAAAKGELVYYVAGDEAAYRRARPLLEATSKEIVEIGEIGQATVIKVATNMVTAGTVQVTAEALALVQGAGVPLEKFADAMRSNGSNSGTLTMKLPKMLSRDFEPHFSVKHMLKDVNIATRLARDYGLRLQTTEVARAGLQDEADRGGADNDYSAVVRAFFPEPPPPPEPAPEEKPPEMAAPIEEPRAPEPPAVAEREPEPEQRNSVDEIVEREEPADDIEDEMVEEAVEPNESFRDEDEIGNAVTANEPEAEKPVASAAAREEETEEQPRGFFSRLFSRSGDY